MRLIDADNFSKVFNSKIFNKLQNEYLNSTADDKTKDVADFVTAEIMTDFNDLIDNAPTVEVPENEVNCILTMFGKCSYNETGCSDCEIKDKIRKALEERSQGKWIPVSEKLPENRDWYLGVFKEPDTDFIGIPYICDYVGEVTKGTTNEGWILRHCTDVDNASDYFRNLICVAWQPLPEPYKKGGSE